MISISRWFERSFQFDPDPRYFPLVLERDLATIRQRPAAERR
ncbi:MAG: hypothetical protein WBW88_13880 [Rhodothermales bacterium]|jgi:hypothetical protein